MPATCFPALACADANAHIEWLGQAFGFVEHAVHRTDDGRVAHAELALDGAIIMLGDASAGGIPKATASELGGSPVTMYFAVEDPDAIAESARAAGAEILRGPEDTDYGSREFSARDPEGFVWSFGTYGPVA